MKKSTCGIVIGVFVLMMAAFAAGAAFSHFAWGYHYKVIDEKSEAYAHGKVVLRHVFEHEGLGFLETEKSVVELERDSGLRMILYKAQCGFQESRPYVSEIKVHYDELDWEDGVYHYHLKLDLLPEPKGH